MNRSNQDRSPYTNLYTPGTGSLEPTDMVRVLGQIDEASRVLGLRVRVPCDLAGRPL